MEGGLGGFRVEKGERRYNMGSCSKNIEKGGADSEEDTISDWILLSLAVRGGWGSGRLFIDVGNFWQCAEIFWHRYLATRGRDWLATPQGGASRFFYEKG